MRHTKLLLAVAAAMAAMMTLAGPAFASTDSGCIHMPISPTMVTAMPATSSAPLLQIVVVAAIAVVAAVAQALISAGRRHALAGATQVAS